VLELVDVVVVHKADGPRVDEARKTAQHYRVAGHLLHHGRAWQPPVLCASSVEKTGLDEVWAQVLSHRSATAHERPVRRAAQAERWLWLCIESELVARFRASPAATSALAAVIDDVRTGRVSPGRAAQGLVDAMLNEAARPMDRR
jgi:LAO/AO transport system kinase